MNMKKIMKAMMATSLALALPAAPMANAATDRDRELFQMNVRSADRDMAVGVRAGQAPIDDAVAHIVPSPYRVLIDDSIPASMYIVWCNGDNWMEVLRRSLAPVDLVAVPDWANNTILIRKKKLAPEYVEERRIATAPLAPVVHHAIPAEQDRVHYAHGHFTQSPHPKGFFVSRPQTRGFFVVSKPDSVTQKSPSLRLDNTLPVKTAKTSSESDEFFVQKTEGYLPEPEVMWLLMKAAANGKKIVLSGASSSINKEKRVAYSVNHAKRLRNKLISVGFPPETIVLGKPLAAKTPKPGVLIKISNEEV